MLLSNDTLLDVFGFVDYATSNHKVLARQRILRATFGYGDDCLNVQIYEETTDEERQAFDEDLYKLPPGSNEQKVRYLSSDWKYSADEANAPEETFIALLRRANAVVDSNIVVEATFHYDWSNIFLTGQAASVVPSLKYAKRLRIADCSDLRPDLAQLNSALHPFVHLKHLELTKISPYIDWNVFRTARPFLRLTTLSVSVRGSPMSVSLRSSHEDVVSYCIDFSHLSGAEKKFVKFRGYECKRSFAHKLIQASSQNLERNLTVAFPAPVHNILLDEPLELDVLISADGYEVLRHKSRPLGLTVFPSPIEMVVTNDADYAGQYSANFVEEDDDEDY